MNFEKVNSIREVFTYIERFKGSLFVLKIEDAVISHPLFPRLMKDIVQMHHTGIKVILVPGTRNTIESNLKYFGVNTAFHNNIRLTSEEALPFVKLAASEVSNTLITQLAANGAQGLVGNWVKAHSLGVLKGVDYARTGKVMHIRSDIVSKLLAEDFIPIIPNIGWNDVGRTYNISSNQVAAQICIDLKASKLFYIGEQQGLVAQGLNLDDDININDQGIIANLSITQAQSILDQNDDIPFAQKDYLIHSIKACHNGVKRVHLVSALIEGAVVQEVFSSVGGGTMVYTNEYEHIRNATLSDVPEILTLMDTFIDSEALVPRTQRDVQESIENYHVYEVDGVLHGCAALQSRSDDTVELCAVAVDKSAQSSGVGRKMVGSLIQKASEMKFAKIYLLTTQAEDWFLSLGFRTVSMEDLPPDGQAKYIPERGSKILMKSL